MKDWIQHEIDLLRRQILTQAMLEYMLRLNYPEDAVAIVDGLPTLKEILAGSLAERAEMINEIASAERMRLHPKP